VDLHPTGVVPHLHTDHVVHKFCHDCDVGFVITGKVWRENMSPESRRINSRFLRNWKGILCVTQIVECKIYKPLEYLQGSGVSLEVWLRTKIRLVFVIAEEKEDGVGGLGSSYQGHVKPIIQDDDLREVVGVLLGDRGNMCVVGMYGTVVFEIIPTSRAITV